MPRRNSYRRRALGLAIAAATAMPTLLGLGPAAVPAQAETAYKYFYGLRSGLRLERVRYPSEPNEVRVLRVIPSLGPSLDVLPAGSSFPMRKQTSGIGASWDAVASVNGDLPTRDGRVKHALMIDGELWTSGLQPRGVAFGLNADGSQAWVGHTDIKIEATASTGTPFTVRTWNVRPPIADQVDGYTPRGGSVVPPPGTKTPVATDPRYCAARLVPSSKYHWSGTGKTSIVRAYRVRAQPDVCRRTPLGLGSDPGAVVLATRAMSAKAPTILALSKGNRVKIAWTAVGWRGVTDIVGGSYMLVDNGKNVAPDYSSGASYVLNYNPRSAVGYGPGCADKDLATICKLFLITIDGRQTSTNWSAGVRLPRLADEFLRAGAVGAINLDGGGSTVMWAHKTDPAYCESFPAVGGCRVDRPSQTSGERSIVVALGVLRRADPGLPASLA